MRFIIFPLVGTLIGFVIGSLLGAGENRWKNKTERAMTGQMTISLFGIFGGVAGLFGGLWAANAFYEDEQKQKAKQRELAIATERYELRQKEIAAARSSLGLNQATTREFTEGRYWVSETRWTDFRTSTDNILRTAKNKDGFVTTTLNGVECINHNEKSANQHTIPSCHQIVKSRLFEQLISGWIEETRPKS